MLAAVCADQRRPAVLHRRFPARRDPRPRRARDGAAGPRRQAQSHRGDAVAWRPEAARYRARAGARTKGAAAGRADRGHGHRGALAHDRQGPRALGAREDHRRVHRARHGHRVQDRARRSSCSATAAFSQPARPMRSGATRPSSKPISAPSITREPRYERRTSGAGRRPRRLLWHQPDPVRRRPFGAAGRDHGAARPQRRRQVDDHEGDHGAGAGAPGQGDAAGEERDPA